MAYRNATESAAAAKNYTGVFYNELENNPAPRWIAQVFRFILSTFREEIIAFTKGFPQMREWLGERRIQSLSEYAVRIEKKDHELTVGVDRDDSFFDKLGLIGDQIRGIAQEVPRHFVNFFVKLCKNGHATNGYDGQPFFSATHPNGNGEVWSNTTGNAFSEAEWEAAKTKAAKIRNADSVTDEHPYGRPLMVKWTHIFFGPNASTAVSKFFEPRTLANGADNIYANKIPAENRIEVQEFGDTGKWYLFDLSKIMKPFALMLVKGLDFVAFDKSTDWHVFQNREYVYGIDTMDNATYLLPELAYGSSVA